MTKPTSRWRALAALLRPDALRWGWVGALVALSSALALAGPLVVRQIVDDARGGASTDDLVKLAALFLAIAVGAQLLTVAFTWSATVTAWHTTNEIRVRLAGHVLGLDHEFHRQHTPGELIQRVDGDVTSVSDFLGQVVPRVVGALAMVFGMILVLAVVDWRLAVGAVLYVVLSALLIVKGRHRAVGEASDEMGAYAKLYGGIEERLTAAEDLRANGAGAHAMWRFIGESAGAMKSAVRRESAFLRLWWAVQGSVAVGASVSLISGAVLVSSDAISLGTAFLMFQYVLLLERPLEDVVHQLETVQKANGAMVRVIDLLAVRPTITDHGTTSPPAGPLSIEFDSVSFRYQADVSQSDSDHVLRDITLSVAAGRSVGIVGRTGSGKTTLSRLVLRLIETTDGQLRLSGVPIGEIPLTELRQRVAMIPQEVELFSGSVRDNVTLFDAAPSDEQVAKALRLAGLETLVAGGIHRDLGAGGTGLSAGEAQLLALARVWVRNPDVVVLDEATSRADPETEGRLEAAVAELIRGRTTLIIAHRLSTLRHVDEIVVIDHGAIVEHGDRDVLVADHASRFHHLLDLALES
jgi:ABC-type multidrug transport system fused ATPase/permease subunit